LDRKTGHLVLAPCLAAVARTVLRRACFFTRGASVAGPAAGPMSAPRSASLVVRRFRCAF